MKPVLEQKLIELIRESEQQGAPAMYLVLNQLLAAYHHGKHHDFAKHAAQFKNIDFDSLVINSRTLTEKGDDKDDSEYIH